MTLKEASDRKRELETDEIPADAITNNTTVLSLMKSNSSDNLSAQADASSTMTLDDHDRDLAADQDRHGAFYDIDSEASFQQEQDYTATTPHPTPQVTSIQVQESILPETPLDLIAPIPNRLPYQMNVPTTHNPTEAVPRYGMLGVVAVVVLTQFCWSGYHIFAKAAFNDIPTFNPVQMPCIRAWGTTIIMFVLCYSQDRNFWRVSRKDLIQLALAGTFMCMCVQNLFTIGLMLTSAADAGLTQPGVPVFAACMSVLLKRERASWLKFTGIGVAILGTFCIVLGETYFAASSSSNDDNSVLVSGGAGGVGTATTTSNLNVDPGRRMLGLLCFAGQTFFFACYILVQKPLLSRLPEMTITFYTFFFGIPTTTAIAGYFMVTMDWSHLPPIFWGTCTYVVAVASVLGFILFSYASKHLPASITAMSITLQPLFSSLLGATILGEVLTGFHILGGMFLIAGLLIVLWSRTRESAQAKLEKDLEMMRLAQDQPPPSSLSSPLIDDRPDCIHHHPVAPNSHILSIANEDDSSLIPTPDWSAHGIAAIDGELVEPIELTTEHTMPSLFSHEQTELVQAE